MNIKLHTPKSLKAGSGMALLKQFLLSLFATTVSIALTFGTAAIIMDVTDEEIDVYRKERDKLEVSLSEKDEVSDAVTNEIIQLQNDIDASKAKLNLK